MNIKEYSETGTKPMINKKLLLNFPKKKHFSLSLGKGLFDIRPSSNELIFINLFYWNKTCLYAETHTQKKEYFELITKVIKSIQLK